MSGTLTKCGGAGIAKNRVIRNLNGVCPDSRCGLHWRAPAMRAVQLARQCAAWLKTRHALARPCNASGAISKAVRCVVENTACCEIMCIWHGAIYIVMRFMYRLDPGFFAYCVPSPLPVSPHHFSFLSSLIQHWIRHFNIPGCSPLQKMELGRPKHNW